MTMNWRAMRAQDLRAVVALADAIHPDHPERPEIFAERLALFPEGARALTADESLRGYAIAHPWAGEPPKLDTSLGALPADSDHLYIHDVALAPDARGLGAARAVLVRFEALTRGLGLKELRLIAVSGSAPTWRRLGFADVGQASSSYGGQAREMRRIFGGPT